MYKNILIKFGLWLGGAIFIFFYGITHSLALTYTNIGDKADITVVLVSTNYGSQPFNVPKNSGYNFNQVLEIDYQINNYNFDANKNYQLETHLAEQTLTNANYYTVQGLNGESCLISYDNTIFTGNYPRFAFQCPHATNSITISISNSSKQYLWTGDGIFNWQTALLKYSDTSLSGNTGSNDDIINNNNQNTQNIINNNTQNTEDIINNQNKNTEDIINNQNNNNLTCSNTTYELNERIKGQYIAGDDGHTASNNNYSVSQYFIVKDNTNYTVNFKNIEGLEYGRLCWYNNNNLLLCSQYRRMDGYQAQNFIITSPTNANKLTLTFRNNSGATITGDICINKLDEQKNAINNLDDTLNNDNTDEATSEASDFFSNFNTNTFGLTSIITAPLNLIQSLTSKTCTPLHLPLPYLNNKYLDLPCMSTIYSQHFGTFFTLYQTITYGIIAYWVCVRIFNHVKDFKNPEHDEIEVVDL